MRYRQLGQSGLLVSELTLGTITFGNGKNGEFLGDLNPDQARRLLDIAFDAGVNIVDTANIYAEGEAEKVLGKALGDKRQDIILATKARSPVGDDPNDSGASRHNLIRACEASLKRLGTDYIDLYQMHNWDGVTPIEETLEALTALVASGKIRYVGTSNYTGWQLMKTMGVAEANKLIRPVSQQINYTPENRDAEYEILPAGIDQNVGTLVWGPLGEGLLTGKVRRGKPIPAGSRQGEKSWPEPFVYDMDRAYDVIETLVAVGEEHGVSAAQVCLAWLKDRPGVTSLIVGVKSEAHIRDNLAAMNLELTAAQFQRIEQASRQAPRYPYWHRVTASMDRIDPAEATFLNEHRHTMESRSK
jgi:aryl-alcohol dehydrogenase-like predicted oxidoreductase